MMSEESPNLESLFLSALEIESPQERAAFLARSCGDDASLQQQVERLLDSHRAAGSFLEKPPQELERILSPDAGAQNLAAAIQAGFAPAFREGEALFVGNASHSVFEALGQTMNLSHVVLRDAKEAGNEPIVQPKSPEMPERKSDSRYRLDGEIARGGMGAILKGRDTDLGRDLAIKVLLDAHKDKPEVVQRFIEEAQIGGQLQHPGIAPIYELGQFADRRPFFAMKLVRGETLSKLLADRTEAAQERGKFIGIFEQICQTMAYAHSRGVIHRDLKPANIMVGAFGEVQVMDWGLAKVLGSGGVADEKMSQHMQPGQSLIQTLRNRVGSDAPGAVGSHGSQTQMGSVMGTPAYMPPEQALGEIDNLDERADVFGLGAILCEILTRQPPYVGDDGSEVFRMARRGKLDDCLARLDACGADAELIALAKHCLELEPNNRPRDAGILAARVSGYLESVEAKLRETELAKVDAQVRAEELRRRQRLTFAAGAAVAASLVVGITASLWQANRAEHEAQRARSAQQQAVAAFDELRASAPAFAEQARALTSRERFDEALEKLDYAVKLRPDAAEYLVSKGDLLQCQFKLTEAAALYRQALRLQPGLARAESSAKLCDELLAAKPNADGKLTRESLAKLHLAMLTQQRPAAELMPVARLLGEQKKLLVQYWLARLKDLPVSAERPLKDRLTVREDGQLALDLSETKVLDLAPLADAPLAALNLSRCGGESEPIDLTPLRNLKLIELEIRETNVEDLAPLSAMLTLERLDVTGTKVADLAPIANLRLKSLNFRGCPVYDLTPIKNMPLEEISLRDTRVTSLAPLVGMPIKSIELANAPLVNFSALAQLPLERCYCHSVQISDLAVLRGRPLKELVLWNCHQARNFAALKDIETLELLVVPASYRTMPEDDYAAIGKLRNLPRLRQMWADGDLFGAESPRVGSGTSEFIAAIRTMTPAVADFQKMWDIEQAFVPALRKSGFSFALDRRHNGRYSLWFRQQAITDLSIIQDAPLCELWCVSCPQLADLSPLRGMRLEVLNVCFSRVADLDSLRGMPLRRIFLSGNKVTDVSPLADSPLQDVYLDRCPVLVDVAPLAKIPTLKNLLVPPQIENLESLRDHPKLERLGYALTGILPMLPESSAEEFWKSYRPHPWVAALRKAGIRTKTMKWLDDGKCELDLSGSTITDLSVLNGAPISRLTLNKTKITDLSPLRGMPLTSVSLGDCSQLTDVSPLAEVKDLRQLVLPPNARNFGFLRGLPKLEYLGYTESVKSPSLPDKTTAQFWKQYDAQGWLWALQDLGVSIKSAKQLPDGTWDLDLSDAKLSDLTLLKGAPISRLNLGKTAVSDLTPLAGMALTALNLAGAKVSDIGPLQGMPIQELNLGGTAVADLSALRGTPLKILDVSSTSVTDLAPLRGSAIARLVLTNTRVTDLSPLQGLPLASLALRGSRVTNLTALRGMPLTSLFLFNSRELTDLSPLSDCRELTSLSLPPNAKDIEFLRALPKLQRLSFAEDRTQFSIPDMTVEEFWKEYDAKQR
jgi:serine/threonine protein kinase